MESIYNRYLRMASLIKRGLEETAIRVCKLILQRYQLFLIDNCLPASVPIMYCSIVHTRSYLQGRGYNENSWHNQTR
jgi:hypothetical protein